jgi:hypothetical protein
MEKRRVAEIALLAGGAGLVWWLTQSGQADAGQGVYAPVDLSVPDLTGTDPTAPADTSTSSYLQQLSLAEDPSQNPLAKNPYSTASGLYQFTKATWTGLGGDWGDDPTLAFGGLQPSVDEQNAMAAKLTAQNSNVLANIGVDISNATLYAAHILGAGAASKSLPSILSSDPSTPLTTFLPSSTVAVNPALGSTVGSFLSYLTAKVGA